MFITKADESPKQKHRRDRLEPLVFNKNLITDSDNMVSFLGGRHRKQTLAQRIENNLLEDSSCLRNGWIDNFEVGGQDKFSFFTPHNRLFVQTLGQLVQQRRAKAYELPITV